MLSNQAQSNISHINEELMEKVILQNDLSGLSPVEKVQHVKNVCLSLGLNPLTKPIQLHKFQGKEVMYMAKDGAEQIRNLHNVSIVKLETEFLKNDLYVVRAYAQKPNGRQDCSTSAISVLGMKGDAIGNAMKKCETQAKRRVTLSICGLGMLDETEIENLPVTPVNTNIRTFPVVEEKPKEEVIEDDTSVYEEVIDDIECCNTMDQLKEVYLGAIKNKSLSSNKDLMNKIIEAKDKKKSQLTTKDFLEEYDSDTGEIK